MERNSLSASNQSNPPSLCPCTLFSLPCRVGVEEKPVGIRAPRYEKGGKGCRRAERRGKCIHVGMGTKAKRYPGRAEKNQRSMVICGAHGRRSARFRARDRSLRLQVEVSSQKGRGVTSRNDFAHRRRRLRSTLSSHSPIARTSERLWINRWDGRFILIRINTNLSTNVYSRHRAGCKSPYRFISPLDPLELSSL